MYIRASTSKEGQPVHWEYRSPSLTDFGLSPVRNKRAATAPGNQVNIVGIRTLGGAVDILKGSENNSEVYKLNLAGYKHHLTKLNTLKWTKDDLKLPLTAAKSII